MYHPRTSQSGRNKPLDRGAVEHPPSLTEVSRALIEQVDLAIVIDATTRD
jgi:hypothetical protein